MVECNIQKTNSFNLHTALLHLSFNPKLKEKMNCQIEGLLLWSIKIYVLVCLGMTLYGIGMVMKG